MGVGWLERMKNVQNHIQMEVDDVVMKGQKTMRDGVRIDIQNNKELKILNYEIEVEIDNNGNEQQIEWEGQYQY